MSRPAMSDADNALLDLAISECAQVETAFDVALEREAQAIAARKALEEPMQVASRFLMAVQLRLVAIYGISEAF